MPSEVLAENSRFDLAGVVGADRIDRGREIGRLAFGVEAERILADQRIAGRCVAFDDRALAVRAVPRPMQRIARDAAEIALLGQEAVVIDEDPDLAFEDIVELLASCYADSSDIPAPRTASIRLQSFP